MLETYIGYLGSFIFSIRLFPQIYTVYTTNNIEGLSESSIFLDMISAICLLIYSSYLKALPLIITNAVTIVCDIILYLLYYRIKHSRNKSN